MKDLLFAIQQRSHETDGMGMYTTATYSPERSHQIESRDKGRLVTHNLENRICTSASCNSQDITFHLSCRESDSAVSGCGFQPMCRDVCSVDNIK